MTISTKAITKQNQQASGKWRVRETHVDTLNRQWTFQYLIEDVATAITIMDARDLSQQIINVDIADILSWVEDGNPPSTFDYTNRDITELEAEEEVFLHFARSEGARARLSAWWIESLNPPNYSAITTRLGWSTSTGEIGDRVQVRALDLFDSETNFNQVEDV